VGLYNRELFEALDRH